MRVHRNGCGLDVHKKIIAVCLIREDAEGNSVPEKRLLGSMTRDLHELAQWLCAAQVTAVAMEATGVYWMPVWNVVEQYGLQLLLINPEHYKAVRGKKTDLKEGTHIAELLQDGRLEGSYVPPVAIRVLRDLTRYPSWCSTNPRSRTAFRDGWSNATSNWQRWPATCWALVRWRCCVRWRREKRIRRE